MNKQVLTICAAFLLLAVICFPVYATAIDQWDSAGYPTGVKGYIYDRKTNTYTVYVQPGFTDNIGIMAQAGGASVTFEEVWNGKGSLSKLYKNEIRGNLPQGMGSNFDKTITVYVFRDTYSEEQYNTFVKHFYLKYGDAVNVEFKSKTEVFDAGSVMTKTIVSLLAVLAVIVVGVLLAKKHLEV